MESDKAVDVIEVHCPTEAELQAEPQVNVPCIVEGCGKTFTTSAARSIHLIQTHKIYKNEDEWKRFNRSHQKNLRKVTKHFYCPVRMCNRSIEQEKPFTRLSLLKQHYYILHAEKKYQCQKCDKRFSTQRQLTTHEANCGKSFYCSCGDKHNTITALYMHAKRKHHPLPEEFASKRRKREPPVERYLLVVPVPYGDANEIRKSMLEPVPLVPYSSTCIKVSDGIHGKRSPKQAGKVIPATITIPNFGSLQDVRSAAGTSKSGPTLATTSTQTDESGASRSPKQTTSSSYAQTAHSCFPSHIPLANAPHTAKRHKKTLAIQTNCEWPIASQVATSETQTLDGEGIAAQTQTNLDSRNSADPTAPPSGEGNLLPGRASFVPLGSPLTLPASPVTETRLNLSTFGLNAPSTQRPIPSHVLRQNSQFDSSGTQTPWSVIAVSTTQTDSTVSPVINTRSTLLPPNEVLTQTDLSFQNLLEYNTSETQTFSNVSDAMTDTSESQASQVSQHAATETGIESMEMGIQSTSLVTAEADVGPSGLDLLFLASTEHRANSTLDLPRMDDLSCCQQTQTGLSADTGHQETQTAWDWSLDEFSFLDQHTQTAQSTSSSSGSDTPMSDNSQFCQTGLDLYSQFSFSNTETQTVSVFDLEMFGTSISVQTEPGLSMLLEGSDSLIDVSTQAQGSPTQQEMVCADVQTEAMDFDRLRCRHLSGQSQLASSQTQTSLWEDIESLMRSDNFTQTQVP
ncbi:uncharacterized protein [Diadema antillarum]|uniref:uncharacterized protein n=1 Tax=Diadema antillarum TaxID=105358 RepID=UPI003A8B7C08